MVIKPKCDMLIDQNKYIGDDQIGHCCYNYADYQTETHFICKDCIELLKTNPNRLTFGIGSVIGWKDRINEVYENMMKQSHHTTATIQNARRHFA